MITKMITMIALLGSMLGGFGWAADQDHVPDEVNKAMKDMWALIHKGFPSARMGSVELVTQKGDDPKVRPNLVYFYDGSSPEEMWLSASIQGGSKFFWPDATHLTTKYRPVVKELPNGWFEITFEVK